ncbi:MAG: enoyl-CoA hydratase/isomerase family protein [Flavobacteriaceae bacterium]
MAAAQFEEMPTMMDYSAYDELKVDRPEDGILRVSFNRPDRMNALTSETHRQLGDIWRDIDRDDTVRAVLLCGEGDHFCAGGEFDLVENLIHDHDLRMRNFREARDLVYNMINCSKPIVSAMQGGCAGGGLAAGLLADISIVTRKAKLVDGHVRLGVAAGDHAVLLWPLMCGLAKAKYHLLLNEPLTGERAEEIGLVSLAVEDHELREKAMEVTRRLAAGAPSAVRWTKYALNNWLRAAGPTFDNSLAREFMGFSGPEVREGVAAIKEKRKPDFPGNSRI